MKRIVLLSLLLFPIFLFAQYPTFSNKQRLGVQTTGDGLIYRGTVVNNIPTYTPSNINNAYFHLDTVESKLRFYNNGSWQLVYPIPQFDTTTLNVYLKISDTTAMLLPYFRDSDTSSLNLINRFALKLNISDTSVMLSPYLRKADTISLSNRINTKLDTIYVKLKNVVTRVLNKDTINIGSSLTDGYAITIIGDSINIDTTILDIRYPDRDSTNELQSITFATTSGVITIPENKVMNLDTLYSSVIDSVNILIQDSIAAFTPLTEGYGINIIGDSINVDTTVIFTQSDTITLSNRINLKLNISDTISLSNRINTKLNTTDTIHLSNRIDAKLNTTDTVSLSNRINLKLDTIYVQYPTTLDTVTNKETITIPKNLTEGFGINIIADSINIDSVVILNTQQKQIAYVKNQSGVTMYKGQAVYSSGSTGNNKLVQLASSNTEQASSKTFGVVESDSIPNGQHGYVITFGLLSGFNTNSLNEGSSIYLSSTLGELTTTKPQAPLHLVTIGICVRQQQNNGSIFVKIQNGFELDEIHDVRITTPVDNASLYYKSSENLWRDTTATLLVSDTANMLSKYVNTYSNQTNINGDKTFNNVITIDSVTVTGKLLVNTNISDAVKINSNTNSTNLELMNSGGSVFIKSGNKNMTLQTDTTALVYLKGDVNKVGILTMSPQQALEVAGTIRVDSLDNNLTPTKLVGSNATNDLTAIYLGNGLTISNNTIKATTSSGDTATLLRQDFLNISNNVLVWTQGNKKLLPYFTQVYRNGQLLKSESQYTITVDSIVTLESGSYKLGDNITIIAIDNIVALAGSGGIITLQGDVSGSGTSTITTTIGNSKVLNSMLAGNISNDKLDNITTAGKVSNSATTATSSNTINAIVSRDASGNFTAGTITANNFYGLASTSTLANSIQSNNTTGVIKLTTSSNAVLPILTVPDVNATIATTNLNQTFGGTQTFTNTIIGNISGNAATVTSITPSNFANQSANTVLAAPNGSSGTPSFRSLVSSDIPSLNYLPLTGGTLTGALTGTTGTFNTRLGVGSYAGSPTLFTSGSGDQEIHFTHSDNIPDRKINLRLTNNNSSYYTYGGLIYALQGDGLNQYNRMTLGVNTTEIMHLTRFSRVGILNNSPSYTLDVNGTFNATGNSLIGGTLGVTGAATFSSSVTGNSFIKSGGTSSQFLKADGTTDSNTYLTTSSAASTYQTILTNPVTGTGANNYLPKFTGASIIGNSVIQESSGNIGIGISPTANLELAKGKFIMLNSREGASQDSAGIMLYETGTKSANDINFGAKIMYNADADNFEIKMKNYNGTTLFNPPVSITIPRTSGDVNIGTALNVTGAATLNNDLVLQTSGARTTTAIRHYYAQQGRYAGEIQFQPSGSSGSLLSFITNQSGFGQTERMRIDELGNVGINDNSPSYTLDVNGTLGVTGAATLSSTLAVTGATTLSTTSATPTALLGKDGSNVVGAVTDISQSGLMKVGSTTQNTSSVGIINVPHGLSYTPTKVIATIAQQNSYVIVCHQITSTNLNFTVYDSTNGAALNNVSVGFFWLAFK